MAERKRMTTGEVVGYLLVGEALAPVLALSTLVSDVNFACPTLHHGRRSGW
jgi:hypothetical protein